MMSPIHNLSESFWTGASQHASEPIPYAYDTERSNGYSEVRIICRDGKPTKLATAADRKRIRTAIADTHPERRHHIVVRARKRPAIQPAEAVIAPKGTHTCKDCGAAFTTKAYNRERCNKCRIAWRKVRDAKNTENRRRKREAEMRALADGGKYAAIEQSFSQRACFQCGATFWCKHREPHVEAAIVAIARPRLLAIERGEQR